MFGYLGVEDVVIIVDSETMLDRVAIVIYVNMSRGWLRTVRERLHLDRFRIGGIDTEQETFWSM